MTPHQLETNIASFWHFSSTGLVAARAGDVQTASTCINEMAYVVGASECPKNLRQAAQKSAVAMSDLCPAAMSAALQALIGQCADVMDITHKDMLRATGLDAEIELEEQAIKARRANLKAALATCPNNNTRQSA